MTYISLLKTEVMGASTYSIGSLDPYLSNARSDNSASYFGMYRNFVLGVTYSFGHDTQSIAGANGKATYNPGATNCPGQVPGDPLACRQITALIGYWGIRLEVNLPMTRSAAARERYPARLRLNRLRLLLFLRAATKTARYMGSEYAKIRNPLLEDGVIHRARVPSQSTRQTSITAAAPIY